ADRSSDHRRGRAKIRRGPADHLAGSRAGARGLGAGLQGAAERRAESLTRPPMKSMETISPQTARAASTMNALLTPATRGKMLGAIALFTPRPIDPPAIWNM